MMFPPPTFPPMDDKDQTISNASPPADSPHWTDIGPVESPFRLPTSDPIDFKNGCVTHAQTMADGGYLFRMWRNGELLVSFRAPTLYYVAKNLDHIAKLMHMDPSWMDPK